MAIFTHRHDFVSSADGYKCQNCDMKITNEHVRGNQSTFNTSHGRNSEMRDAIARIAWAVYSH